MALYLALATACFHTGDVEAQLAWAERALAAAEEIDDDDGRWRSLVQIAEVAPQVPPVSQISSIVCWRKIRSAVPRPPTKSSSP